MDNKYIYQIENALNSFIPSEDCNEKNVVKSLKYSLTAPGKRLRPTLLLAFCEVCGGNVENALPFACAVEMIHTYSLIHDDLPCMDNDDLRRGKPSNHVVFGEDIALLAGDALQALAYEAMLNETSINNNGLNAAKAAFVLAKASGINGMVGGQVIDLETEGKNPPYEIITEMYSKKTGQLIKAPCIMGCILANADEEEIAAAGSYAEKIGLAFQIVDDILDVISDEKTLGKPIGSDKENNKVNYVTLLGIDKSVDLVNKLTDEATSQLKVFKNNTDFLRQLALDLAKRIN